MFAIRPHACPGHTGQLWKVLCFVRVRKVQCHLSWQTHAEICLHISFRERFLWDLLAHSHSMSPTQVNLLDSYTQDTAPTRREWLKPP